ncbi:MAG: LPS-assembly lipoprotein [Lentisphaeria bacterium]|jgi:LPS-assembly lipoprotein
MLAIPRRHSRLLASTLAYLCLTLGACGWQLRGAAHSADASQQTAIKDIALHADLNQRDFQMAFIKNSKSMGVALDRTSRNQLYIHKESVERRPLSFSSTGIPVQYQIMMRITFSFSRDGQNTILKSDVTARQNYDFDPQLIIAKNDEEQQLRQELREQLVQRILANVQASVGLQILKEQEKLPEEVDNSSH